MYPAKGRCPLCGRTWETKSTARVPANFTLEALCSECLASVREDPAMRQAAIDAGLLDE